MSADLMIAIGVVGMVVFAYCIGRSDGKWSEIEKQELERIDRLMANAGKRRPRP